MKKNKDIKSSPLDVYNFSSDSEQVTEYDTRDEDEFYDDFDNDVSEHRSRVDQNHTSASNWLKKILSFTFWNRSFRLLCKRCPCYFHGQATVWRLFFSLYD